MNLNEKLIAIVGPNEAGKSSVLSALTLLNADEEIPGSSRTRGESFPNDQVVIRARFRLNDDERELSETPLAENEGIWLLVSKLANGQRTYSLDPAPERDLKPRRSAVASLARELENPWVRKLVESWSASGGEDPPPDARIAALRDALATDDPTLESTKTAALQAVIDLLTERIDGLDISKTGAIQARRLVRRLEVALATERRRHPADVSDAIKTQIPKFLEFATPDRNLRAQYNLTEADDFNDTALRNLAAAAGLRLGELRDASGGVDPGKERALVEAATAAIDKRLSAAWRQSPLTISFGLDGRVLRVTVSSHEFEFFSLDDRSAGLRMFIALRMFLARHRLTVPPVLLVDEAETHLHYDAQADLIRVFEAQKQATQVIYTTHSIGCLPQDLGRGIRVVVPASTGTRSTIESVWGRRQGQSLPGVSPLLLAMGARTIPLAPSRYVVIAEGLSDAMLAPTLLREATGLSTLGYQIVGGLAEATEQELRRLDLEAPRVAYLVDGDQSGKQLAKRLTKLGIDSSKIVAWSPWARKVQLEDVVDTKAYRAAVNQCMLSWPPNKRGPAQRALEGASRPNALRAWCRQNMRDEPSKILVAEELLRQTDERAGDSTLVDPKRVDLATGVHEQLTAALGIGREPAEP